MNETIYFIVLILIFTIENIIITFLYQNVNTIFFILDKVVHHYCFNNVSTFFNHYIYNRNRSK